MPDEASSSSCSAKSANTSTSARSPADSGPGSARYNDSTPTRIAPACSGSANIARAPAATASGTNPGHRAAADSRSAIRTGAPSQNSSAARTVPGSELQFLQQRDSARPTRTPARAPADR